MSLLLAGTWGHCFRQKQFVQIRKTLLCHFLSTRCWPEAEVALWFNMMCFSDETLHKKSHLWLFSAQSCFYSLRNISQRFISKNSCGWILIMSVCHAACHLPQWSLEQSMSWSICACSFENMRNKSPSFWHMVGYVLGWWKAWGKQCFLSVGPL